LTLSGYKRLRASVACLPCRKRKAKCDASRPSCSTCLRLKSRCSYDGDSPNAEQWGESASPERRSHGTAVSDERDQNISVPPFPVSKLSLEPPAGSGLLLYIDAFLQNVHPVGCNNFLHPSVLGERLRNTTRALILALCGVAAKFTSVSGSQEQGRVWIEEASGMVFQSLDNISTLNITVLQFLATHQMQDGNFVVAWNLTGKSTDL
jgi:hypothetical protein